MIQRFFDFTDTKAISNLFEDFKSTDLLELSVPLIYEPDANITRLD